MFPSGPSAGRDGGDGLEEGADSEGEVGGMRGAGAGAASGDVGEGAFASLLRGGETPMCKHLLACLLVERCAGLFGGFLREREVGLEEWVGWEAGWGG